MQSRYLAGVLALAVFALGFPLAAQATAVGRFVQVEGSVDLMKGGKAPAVSVKVQDEVQQGDAVRTKSQSRAQIRFMDDTVLTLAPESRVAIDEYTYDPGKSQRQATVEVFRGMVHFLVSKILQTEKPDFIMKTHTGVLGVRGTGWYAQLTPLSTDIYNEHGTTQVQNLFPEVPGIVTLTGLEFTRVAFNLPPTLPMPITQQDLLQLKVFFSHFNGGGGGASPLATGPLAGGGGPGTLLGTLFTLNNEVNNPANNPTFTVYTSNTGLNNPANNPLIPSPTPGPAPGPSPGTYDFSMDLYGYRTDTITTSATGSTPGIANSISANWGELTMTSAAPEYFTTSGSGTRTSLSYTGSVGSTSNYTATDVLSGIVSGVLGSTTLTGTYSATFTNSKGTSGTFSGPITINPDGTFNFNYTNLTGSNGTYTVTGTGSSSGTPGTYFTQSASGSITQTGNASGNQQTFTNANGYPIWGTRTGVYPGQFSATINMTSTAPVNGYYPPADQGSLAATMQGVVSGPAGGAQTGVMTTLGSGQGDSSNQWTLAGPVTINPDGSLSATFYGTNADNSVTPAPSGIFKQQGTWTQTAATIPTASTYSFSIPLTDSVVITPTSTTQATYEAQGFGTRSGVFPGTYLNQVDNGTLSGPSGSFTVGNGSSESASGTLTGTVTGVLGGYTLTGNGSYTGTSTTGGTINYSGPITISPNGQLTFNYTGTVTQGETTVTGAGTMTEQFGIALTQSASGTYYVAVGGSNVTLLNTGQMSGTQTVSGLASTATNGSLALSYGNGAPLPMLTTGTSGSYSVSGAGAVSPWYGGQLTYGVLGSTVTVGGSSVSQTPMQITYDPTTRNLNGQIAVGSGGYGPYINGILATTPTSSGLITSSFYESLSGGYQLTSSSPYSTASFTSSGGSGSTGTMYLGGSGAVNSYAITSNFNFTGASQAGAFTPDSGSAFFNMIGAVIGQNGGTQTGTAMGSLNGSGEASTFNISFGGPSNNFTINTNSDGNLPATLTLNAQNSNGTINGYPMTVNGTLTQTDPPAVGTATTTGTNAWAYSPFLSSRFTRLTGTSLGSRIQGMSDLIQPGTSGNPISAAANLRAFRRLRQQRLAALRTASGATTGGRTPGNPAGPILTWQRH